MADSDAAAAPEAQPESRSAPQPDGVEADADGDEAAADAAVSASGAPPQETPLPEAPPPAAPLSAGPPPPPQLAPLPEGWAAVVDPASGATYYWNSSSGTTSWSRPTSDASERMRAAASWSGNCSSAAQADYFASLLGDARRPTGASGWEKHSDPATYVPYFFHAATQRTQWEPPAEGFEDRTVSVASTVDADAAALNAGYYSQSASFNTQSGRFGLSGGQDYWASVNRPSDREGRMMSHYFDLSTLEQNRKEAQANKGKASTVDWKKYAKNKKAEKQKRKIEDLLAD
ncbi:hypothetical protein M885DRAFT_617666 [Pelagophyceae sp. CCMP2097]|nr:hypothetical protein M885DRAFT_617666 [Pelagophyceae sp. CCMP2097]